MKLRKALDKAKEERQSGEGSIPALDKKMSGEGWDAPVYTESTAIKYDPVKLAENRCVCIQPDGPAVDAYKVLRTQLQQRTKEKGWNTIMVTSVGPREGKSLTAVNLALSFAKEFHQTVLLVDGDLKQQSIHEYLGFSSQRGLIDYLVDDQPLKDLIIWPGIEKLTFISGGKTIKDSTELLGSPKMKSLVADMKSRYKDRYIIFDMPPLLERADALTFAPLVDCILIVVEEGRTSKHDIRRAMENVPKEKLLGFVLNRGAS